MNPDRNRSLRLHHPAARSMLIGWQRLCAGLIAALLMTLSIKAEAQLSCPTTTTHIGHGPARAMETWSGGGESLLLVGEGAVLVIYNVATPTTPIKLGEIGLSGLVGDIDIRADGNVAVVSDVRESIRVVNIANRSAPTLLGRYLVPQGRIPRGVSVVGNRVYAAITPAGLGVIDISTPTNPTLLAQVVTPGTDFVFDVEVRGNYAYVADDGEGITIWNISDPANPVAAGTYANAIGASNLLISGARAYVARRDQGYDILDLGTPTAPVLLGSISEIGSYSHGVLINNRLVLAAGPAGLRAFNINNPAAPLLISTFPMTNALSVAGLGNTTWVPAPSALRGISYATPSNPTALTSIALESASETVHADGDRLYVPRLEGGLNVYSNAAANRGSLLGRYTGLTIYRATTIGQSAIVASVSNDATSLRVLNVANPNAITLLATLPLNGAVQQFEVVGTRVFAATQDGLKIFDLANPSAPALIGSWQDNVAGTLKVRVIGNRAYVGGNGKVSVLNISNIASPTLLGQFTLSNAVTDMVVAGNDLYVADGTEFMKVLNISNPAAISLRGSLDIYPGIGYALALNGNALYIAAGPLWGTLIADVSNPANPAIAGNYATPNEVIDVAFENQSVIAAENHNGVRIVSCSSAFLFSSGFESTP